MLLKGSWPRVDSMHVRPSSPLRCAIMRSSTCKRRQVCILRSNDELVAVIVASGFLATHML